MSILIFLGYIIIGLFALTALSFAPWVPTKKRDIVRAIKLSGLQSGEVFYDLGCGDGRVVIEAAKL
jgi:precorrin-6B methylase 2